MSAVAHLYQQLRSAASCCRPGQIIICSNYFIFSVRCVLLLCVVQLGVADPAKGASRGPWRWTFELQGAIGWDGRLAAAPLETST